MSLMLQNCVLRKVQRMCGSELCDSALLNFSYSSTAIYKVSLGVHHHHRQIMTQIYVTNRDMHTPFSAHDVNQICHTRENIEHIGFFFFFA
jgi:hypothetical protein